MPRSIKAYRIFIASPGGLQDVRGAFREVINEYNEAEAIHRGALFTPVGWELTLGGVGRPQSLINEEIKECDLFILVLWNRWGSAPDTRNSKYSSGTEEEFYLAVECLGDEKKPLRQIVLFFKAVEPQQLSDPGGQLQKVLDFKKKIEEEKQHLFHTFDVLDGFRALLRRHLGQWLREHETGKIEKLLIPSPSAKLVANHADDLPVIEGAEKQSVSSQLLDKAGRLTKEGQLTEAEAVYALAVSSGDDPEAFYQYGRFVFRDGRFSQAEKIFERGLELAQKAGDQTLVANNTVGLGNIYSVMNHLDKAEEMQRKALDIYDELKSVRGGVIVRGNLALLLRKRGAIKEAKQMYEEALALYQDSGDEETLIKFYSNLGSTLMELGEPAHAEKMFKAALELSLKIKDKDLAAIAYAELGIWQMSYGDVVEAEKTLRQALDLAEERGLRFQISRVTRNLGYILDKRGDLAGAEDLLKRSLRVSELIGNTEGIALAYSYLGYVLQKGDRIDEAELMFRKSGETYEKLGDLQDIAESYRRLAKFLKENGKPDEAEEFNNKASEILKREQDIVQPQAN